MRFAIRSDLSAATTTATATTPRSTTIITITSTSRAATCCLEVHAAHVSLWEGWAVSMPDAGEGRSLAPINSSGHEWADAWPRQLLAQARKILPFHTR